MLDTKKLIGERIAFFLEQKKISQKTLADIIGVTPSSVSQYVKGTKQPGTTVLGKIVAALGVSSDEFFVTKCDGVRFKRHKMEIREFQQPILAEEINADMVELEKYDPSELKGVSGFVKSRLEWHKSKEKAEEPRFSKNNAANQ